MGSMLSIPMFDLFKDIKPFLPTQPMGVWRLLFDPEIPWGKVARQLAQMGALSAVFLALSLLVTDRKDVTA